MGTWERESITTTRGSFEVFTKGQGEPLCVTHHYSAFNETGDYFAESFTHSHKVYLINLREAGNSEKISEPYQLSLLETIFDLEAIREALRIETWSYAGHSIGGVLGVLYGIYYSNRLRANVITGAAARDYTVSSAACIYHQAHPDFKKMQELIESLKRKDLLPDERKRLSAERTKLSLERPEKYGELFNQNIHKAISPIRLNYFNRELSIFDVTKKLGMTRVKTLILCGEHDVQCPLEFSIEMEELLPNSELITFPESNHYPFLEERELFTKAIDEFFGRIDAS
ncbi:alpha/beta hydrolase [Halobacillus sp. A1]|uniref:alpha/beta fold hydrolase n=1 Tax=Halobacillus sp. A1 TaxID=2880262 RepID=UPI0020A68EA2|nr:alpha/beta hydrolase [Halobacillus sp. A1]MCP3031585.1 alpha/beta hydrolase [Halobacillus sp. A1]